ncbi:MAG: penicillin acylase family protein, partial [Dehalococcoidia bacterium]
LPGYEEGHLLIVPPGATYTGPSPSGLEELTKGAAFISPFAETEAGSNNWVLAGSRTASGKPLIAGDPHRPLDTPNVYYQNHLSCPEFDVVGLSFPGVPGFPHFGHNARVAWCVTHAMADYQDLYIERFKEGDPGLYEFRGEWRQADVYQETIKVRDGKPDQLQVTVTHHGPIILGDPSKGHGIAFRYTATAEPMPAANAIHAMLRAGSVDEMEEAMRCWVDPVNNLLFADLDGNIGYLTRGKLPIRSPANAWLPVPGWTGEHEWQGMVPFEEMPRIRNPEDGYIITANNRVVDENYPHYIALDYWPEFRARRIWNHLLDIDKAHAQDMPSIHAENTSIPAQQLVRLLPSANLSDPDAQAAGERLAEWDGRMDVDRMEPTIYSAFRDALAERIAESTLGPLFREALKGEGQGGPVWLRRFEARLPRLIQKRDADLLPPGEDWDSLMASALTDAVAQLRQRLGPDMDSWTWGRVHATRPKHTLSQSFPELADLLDPPAVSIGGDGDTPLAASYAPSDPYTVTTTSAARYVFDLGDWSNSGWVVPLGVSGNPGSPHYADQVSTWAEVRLLSMLYDWKRIAAESESRQLLNPQT